MLPRSFAKVKVNSKTSLTFSSYSLTNSVTRLMVGMKVHLIKTHLEVPRSNIKVTLKKKKKKNHGRFGDIYVGISMSCFMLVPYLSLNKLKSAFVKTFVPVAIYVSYLLEKVE